MDILKNKTIGEIVAKDYRSAQVFNRYNIDFCCNGNRFITDVCQQERIDEKKIREELKKAMSPNGRPEVDYDSWPLDLMVDYILKKHHRYVEDTSMVLKGYLAKIERVHGQRHPELGEIRELFELSAGQLAMHMKKEELILFPFIKKLMAAKALDVGIDEPKFGTVRHPIAAMIKEHDDEGEAFRKIAKLTNNYTPPSDACNTFKVTYHLLREFQDDLHLHIHLENNLLFPKAVALEKEMIKQ